MLAYQAAASLKAGRLKIVLAKFEQPPLPIHIVYPTSRLLSAKVRTFIDLVTEISRLAFWLGRPASFFGTTRNVAVGARDHDVVGLDRLCAKQIVLPVLITSVSTASHCPTCAVPMKSTASEIVTSDDRPAHRLRAAIAHRVVGKRGDQPAMDQARGRWCAALPAAAR